MKLLLSAAGTVAAGLILVGTVVATRTSAPEQGDLPPLPAVPQTTPIEVVFAQPFTLEEPGVHTMRAEQPSYLEGMLLVLRTDPERWRVRQSYDNVLYVGAETAERVNLGDGSGHLVVIVPGPLDLASARVFLGEPELPERVTKAEAERQLALAVAAGVPPLGSALARVTTAPPVFAADELELRLHASYLVERYSPDEQDLIASLRVKRVPKR